MHIYNAIISYTLLQNYNLFLYRFFFLENSESGYLQNVDFRFSLLKKKKIQFYETNIYYIQKHKNIKISQTEYELFV